MPVDLAGAAGYRRIEGLRAALTAEQEAAVVKVDVRLLPWGEDLPAEEFAAAKAELEAEAAANPKRSTLLDKLRAGEPVVVSTVLLRDMTKDGLADVLPPWAVDPKVCKHARIYADDLIEPAGTDAVADQRAHGFWLRSAQ